MQKEEAEILLQRYREGKGTTAEKELVENWFQKMQETSDWQVPEEESEVVHDRMLAYIQSHMEEEETPVHSISFFRRYRWWAAAAVLLLAGIGGYRWQTYKESTIIANVKQDLLPGNTGATLVLANGQKLLLDSAGHGIVAKQNGVQVMQQNGQLTYSGQSLQTLYNTISTPAGKTFRLALPDGTLVWLNASSSITFPVAFTGEERQVGMTGEAYFEVVHNEKQPFRIKSGNVWIEDIGTAFNVNAYKDETSLKTTLVEGAVKIALLKGDAAQSLQEGRTLRPGEQAALNSSGKMTVSADVDMEEVMAWKNGNFRFSSADIHTIMRQVARWYNVEVIYEGNVEGTFSGGIGRNVNASELLHILESTDKVRFEIDSKKIIVRSVK